VCFNGVGDTHSFIDSYFAIFVTPAWVGGYLLFWNEVRALDLPLLRCLLLP
jgi:hypothetical protein